jgi:hypothetical protein
MTPSKEAGVDIVVKELTPGTTSEFKDPLFLRNLRRIIARDYTLHLHFGIRISLNGKAIKGIELSLKAGGEFQPLRTKRTLPFADGQDVEIELVAGMGAAPPDSNAADEADGDERWGWYVICNGRVVLAGDKTAAAGWGTEGWPQWHGQYNGFIGIVLFSSKNAAHLPLTTTKRSVDTSALAFRSARPQMRDVSKEWTTYTNARKPVLAEFKAKEEATASVPIYQIPMRREMSLPVIEKPKRSGEKVANINYSVPLKRFRTLAEAMGDVTMNYRELGQETFDYAYKQYVGRD